MRNNRDRRKTTISGDRFFQMHDWLLRSQAWRAATVFERCLYFELKTLYNGRNNGDIALSHRQVQKLLNCSNKPVAAAFKGLLQKGFIRIAQIGSFHWKNGVAGGRSTRWILTEYPVDLPERSLIATKDFMQWKPAQEGKQRCAVGTPLVGSEHTNDSSMVGQEHTNVAQVYAHGIR